MVLFPPPFYFVFDISNSYRTYKIISSYELARPVMGIIFLVYVYLCASKNYIFAVSLFSYSRMDVPEARVSEDGVCCKIVLL